MQELTATVNEDFEDRTSSCCIYVAIGETQVLQSFANSKALRKSYHTLASKLIVVQLEDLNVAVRFRMQHCADKLTA